MLWAKREWRYLLGLIDQLPRASRFWEAMLTDEQTVDQLIEMQERAKRAQAEGARHVSGPPISTWTPEVEALHRILDAVGGVQDAVIASVGGKPGKRVPSERPRTAYDEVQARRRERAHEDLVARVLPHKRKQGA